MKLNNSITDVSGIEVGHAQNDEALTGCSVVLCRQGAIAGVDVRGGAPGTRETDLLNPVNLVDEVHAVMLAGGSAYGLDAASGVMHYLEENDIGLDTGVGKVPIVPAAILFDLMVGRPEIRPDAEMGYQAASAASSKSPAEGNFGAGTGASVGKIFGAKSAMKAGIGSASVKVGEVVIGALVAVNAFGDVIDPQSGHVVAGARSNKADIAPEDEGYFLDTLEVMKTQPRGVKFESATNNNTVIGVIATDAKLTKAEATKVAQMAQDGLARAIRPAHTMLDGDTIFALATGEKAADTSTVGAFAAEVMAEAIIRGVQKAAPASGLPGLNA